MSLRSASLLCALALTTSSALTFQDASSKQALQSRVAELKASTAANRAALQHYQWTQTTTILLKGQTRKTEQSLCHYGPDGKVQKTPLDTPPEPPQRQRGLKGRIIEKKVDEMKDYGARLKSLIGEYVPPNPEKIQDVFESGNASLAPSSGATSLTFSNYYKPGDKLIFAFDPTAKKIRNVTIDSYLDDPRTDIVTLTATFATLPDGTNYVAMTDLKADSRNMEIRTVNSNYQKTAQ
ncbi:MAG: hypothetical protein JWP98_142 [Edaphobacter sp.]|nr:hypothetical protein [Edaphobacter sp.]